MQELIPFLLLIGFCAALAGANRALASFADPHLAPDWQDCDDRRLRDLIELNEKQREMIRAKRRFRGQKAILRRLNARIEVLQREEERRSRESA